ncbi:hypothetical protein BB559_003223 [Furculomyces boomerangus]|uniref:Cwf15/Cwc15 cell cycle control protein n=1 Tax=Furculomyces boomerangus TaxID=61424 RepID=A0A2T9YMP2_9FUNG|nr:hypothetical protein BB559_003223 [Furculomyces boomerangus]
MTTAARPTFDSARGRDSNALTLQISARDLPAHTKIKYRKPGQGGDADYIDNDELKQELLIAEKKSIEKAKMELFGTSSNGDKPTKTIEYNNQEDNKFDGNKNTDEIEKQKQLYLQKLQQSDSEDSDEDSESQDESDESDDETALLMQELAKIKKERELEKKKKELDEQEMGLADRREEIMSGNPLLNEDLDFTVKRRWDDDTVFKNQARDMDLKPKKRFINDMLRSDFHRKFMKRFIQ